MKRGALHFSLSHWIFEVIASLKSCIWDPTSLDCLPCIISKHFGISCLLKNLRNLFFFQLKWNLKTPTLLYILFIWIYSNFKTLVFCTFLNLEVFVGQKLMLFSIWRFFVLSSRKIFYVFRIWRFAVLSSVTVNPWKLWGLWRRWVILIKLPYLII